MYKIGLTGGIAAGKSSVANLFAERGVTIIDADLIARQLVEKDQPALIKIQQHFGDSVINADGSLNRQKLSDIIFSNKTQKIYLENILHPLIYATIQCQIDSLSDEYCILAIPLLFETKMQHFVDRILVVDCPVELQISRLKLRDQHNDAKINNIIESQVSREFRRQNADDILDNSSDYSALAAQVLKLHTLYLSIAKKSFN